MAKRKECKVCGSMDTILVCLRCSFMEHSRYTSKIRYDLNPEKFCEREQLRRSKISPEEKKKNKLKNRQIRAENREIINAKKRENYATDPTKYKAQDKARRDKNPEKYRAQQKARRAQNLEKFRAINRAWRAKNAEAQNARNRKKYFENIEFKRTAARIKYAKNPEKFRAQKIKERSKNPEKDKAQRAKSREKYKNDPNHKIHKSISSAILYMLKSNNSSKMNSSILKYIPNTIEIIRQSLEAKFEPWMTWETHGKFDPNQRTWQIDHIIPQSVLPYTSMEDENFKLCWSVDNLQPLEAIDNLRKGAKLNWKKE